MKNDEIVRNLKIEDISITNTLYLFVEKNSVIFPDDIHESYLS